MTYLRKISDEDMLEFLKTLPENPRLKFDPRTITEKAIQDLKEKEAEAHEELIESIIATEKWLHPEADFSLAQAESLAEKWKLSILPPTIITVLSATSPNRSSGLSFRREESSTIWMSSSLTGWISTSILRKRSVMKPRIPRRSYTVVKRCSSSITASSSRSRCGISPSARPARG